MIARALNLPEPDLYTGHSLRRSSASALAESGVDILTLKRYGRWRSDAIAERYVTESVHHQVSVAKKICYGTNNLETAAAAAEGVAELVAHSSSTDIPPGIHLGSGNIFNGPVTIHYH